MLRVFLIGTLGLSILAGCSSEDCVDNSGTYCDEGVAYWTNSCGDIGEIKEDCACGCRADHTDCKRCECACEQVSACCDGCRPVNEADECDDMNPATEIDMCAGGQCKGFALQRTAPDLPAEPAAPAPVHLESWTCPAGWNAVQHDTLTDAAGDPFNWCEPPDMPSVPRLKLGTYLTPLQPGEQDGDRPVCEPEVDGTFPMLGHADCQPLGVPCPAGEWPEVPAEVTGARIYVLAGAAGNGTQASPFGSIAQGVNLAAAGDVVVIGAGVYPEMVAIDKNLTLWGKCVQQSVIDAPGPYVQYSDGAVMVGGQAQVTIRNLRISGGQNGVRLNSRNADVLLEGVWIHQATREGVSQSVFGGSVRLSGVLIDSMQALSDGSMGWGIGSREGCSVQMESSSIELAREVGVWSAANTIHLQDALIRNTLPRETGRTAGRGLEIQTQAAATVQRALFDHNRSAGIAVLDHSSAVLEDVVVHDTQRAELGFEEGTGIIVQVGSQATIRRSQFIRNRGSGVFVTSSGSGATLEDVNIRDTLQREQTGELGNGIWAQDGATLVANRCLLERNKHAGILAASPGTQVELTDLVVLDTQDDRLDSQDYLGSGEGLLAEDRASVTVVRGLFERNQSTGVLSRIAGTELSLERVVVRDTLPMAGDSSRGYCLEVSAGGRCEVAGGVFEKCRGIGILAGLDQASLILQDVTVRDIQSEESTQEDGIGMWIGESAQATLDRGLFVQNRWAGVLVTDPGTIADLNDITVEDSLPQESDGMCGWGLQVGLGALVSVTRGRFERNREAGIGAYAAGTRLQLQDVTVKDTQSDSEILEEYPEAGLKVAQGAHVVLTRGLFEGNRTSGILVGDNNAVAELDGVTVRDTLSQEGLGVRGVGIWVAPGGYVKCTNSLFERNREVGIFAQGTGARLELERVTVRDTLTQESGKMFGRGLNVQQGATARMAYSVIDGNQSVGVFVQGEGSAVDLEEVLVANTRSRELDLLLGRGLSVQEQATAVVRSSVFWKNRDVNVSAYGQDVELTLERVLVKDSLQCDCATADPPTCEGLGAGTGLGSYVSANVRVDAVNVVNSEQAGVQLAFLGTMTGSKLKLRNNPIGVNIQDVPGDYDFFEAVIELLMEENGINFDSTALYVPDPMDALGID